MLKGLGYVAHIRFACAVGVATVRAHRCIAARTGAGIFTVTIDEAVNAVDAVVVATSDTASGAATFVTVVHTSDTVKTVSNSTATGAASDTGNLNVTVLRAYAS